jgi:NSS family neurotransmitter:Na+ symporter
MVLTIMVVSRGIESGIERASRVMMPMLFAFLLVLLGYALTSPGAGDGLAFLLRPRFSELGAGGVLAAMGQAFFSLSIGMGAMITYGSYLGRDRSIARAACLIAGMDTMVAILSGLVVFPLVFSFGLEPAAGPGLLFKTLPTVFPKLPAPDVLATLFFALILFAALTSAISLLEVVVSFVVDELGFSRRGASWWVGGVIFALGVPSAVVDGFLDRADALASNWMLPVGGLFIAVFAGWSLHASEAERGYAGTTDQTAGYDAWRFCVKFLAPVAVGIVLLQTIGLLG